MSEGNSTTVLTNEDLNQISWTCVRHFRSTLLSPHTYVNCLDYGTSASPSLRSVSGLDVLGVDPLTGTQPVLYIYDYLLTLDLEVENIWRVRKAGTTILFLLNRYLGLAFVLMGFLSWFGSGEPVSTTSDDNDRCVCLPL